jgi:hypothetical protein
MEIYKNDFNFEICIVGNEHFTEKFRKFKFLTI